MSTVDQPHGTSIATRLDASRTVPHSDHDQGTVHPYTHRLPASPQHPSDSQLGFTSQYPAFPSFTPAANSMGGNNCYATYPGNGTVYPPALFMPPTRNPIAPMNHAHFQVPYYPVFNPPAATTANATTSILTSENIGREVPASLRSTYSLLSQAVPFEPQVKPKVQDTQEEVAVEAQQPGLGDVQSKDGQSQMQPYASVVEQQDVMIQSHGNNLQLEAEWSSYRGALLGVQNTFVAPYQDAFSAAPFGGFVGDAVSPVLDEGQSTSGQYSHVHVNSDPLPAPHLSSFWSPALSESIMTSLTSSSAQASPSEFSLSPPNFSAAPSPSGAVETSASTARKQRRFVPYSVDHPRRQRQRHSQRDIEKIIQGTNGKKKRVRKPADGDFICLICEILNASRPPFSRKDALKRHILELHMMFSALIDEKVYNNLALLAPRHNLEDLTLLTGCCIILQNTARAHGVQIAEEQDLKSLHPVVAASLEIALAQ